MVVLTLCEGVRGPAGEGWRAVLNLPLDLGVAAWHRVAPHGRPRSVFARSRGCTTSRVAGPAGIPELILFGSLVWSDPVGLLRVLHSTTERDST